MEEIDILDKQLAIHFKDKFVIQPVLTRSLVSFQANKTRAVYRWYKFKEGFSASLIEYLLQQYKMVRGYFCEMTCVIAESARLMKSGAW